MSSASEEMLSSAQIDGFFFYFCEILLMLSFLLNLIDLQLFDLFYQHSFNFFFLIFFVALKISCGTEIKYFIRKQLTKQ